MRRNFSDVIKNGNISIEIEYSKLFHVFYDKESENEKSFFEIISYNFMEYPEFIRGTCLSFEEFNRIHKFRFERNLKRIDVEFLVSFAEYIYNLLYYLDNRFFFHNFDKEKIIRYIDSIIEKIGYTKSKKENLYIFIPRDSCAISVSESRLVPDEVSYKILAYNHSSKKGNIEEKKIILIKLAEILESKRSILNSGFSSDLFFLFNNCNIRHNNIDSNLEGKYRRYIAEMSPEELEHTYDEIYQMCLYAFMQIEHADRKNWIEELKRDIT